MIATKYYDTKVDELHFVDQIIRNLNHLKYMYSSKDSLKDEKELTTVEIHLRFWHYKQFEINAELNDMKGYPDYQPPQK